MENEYRYGDASGKTRVFGSTLAGEPRGGGQEQDGPPLIELAMLIRAALIGSHETLDVLVNGPTPTHGEPQPASTSVILRECAELSAALARRVQEVQGRIGIL